MALPKCICVFANEFASFARSVLFDFNLRLVILIILNLYISNVSTLLMVVSYSLVYSSHASSVRLSCLVYRIGSHEGHILKKVLFRRCMNLLPTDFH